MTDALRALRHIATTHALLPSKERPPPVLHPHQRTRQEPAHVNASLGPAATALLTDTFLRPTHPYQHFLQSICPITLLLSRGEALTQRASQAPMTKHPFHPPFPFQAAHSVATASRRLKTTPSSKTETTPATPTSQPYPQTWHPTSTPNERTAATAAPKTQLTFPPSPPQQ